MSEFNWENTTAFSVQCSGIILTVDISQGPLYQG